MTRPFASAVEAQAVPAAGLMWPSLVVEENVVRDERRRWPSPSTRTWSSNSRRRVPTKRSARRSCSGPDRGANDFGADGFKQAREPSA